MPRLLRIPLVLLALLGALVVTACSPASTSVAPSASAPPTASAVPPTDELIEVAPGRSLAVTCNGSGSPTVIFLHGGIQPQDGVEWAHAPKIRALIEPTTRYCEYERTNVGRSSAASGPIPVTETVADLDAVITGVGIDEPVVLLAASFGGLIGYTYAGTHPEKVAGVVLLDPTLPDELALERQHLDEADRLTPDAWQDSKEKVDSYGAFAVAQRALPSIPRVPGTIFVTEELWAPDGEHAEAFRQGVRAQQADLIQRFSPARTITVDAPHAMTPVIPDQIADAVLEIVRS